MSAPVEQRFMTVLLWRRGRQDCYWLLGRLLLWPDILLLQQAP